jgi:hypothetical protein
MKVLINYHKAEKMEEDRSGNNESGFERLPSGMFTFRLVIVTDERGLMWLVSVFAG